MKNFGKTLQARLLAAVVLIAAAPTVWGDVSAEVDRTQVSLGDSLTLTITATDNENINDINLSTLQQRFDILGNSTNSSINYFNGKRSSKIQRILQIAPKDKGELEIPAFHVGGKTTDAITISVGAAPIAGSADERVRVEMITDQSEVYVQEQLLLTFRISLFENVSDSRVSELKIDNAFVKQLEQKNYRRRENGREAVVFELRYAVFPQLSGEINIPAMSFSGVTGAGQRSVFGYSQRGQRLSRSTKAMTVTVKPRPANYSGRDWLPASDVTVKEHWSKDPNSLQAGESVTRTISITAEGLQGLQLPLPVFDSVDGISSFPDQDINTDTESANGVTGNRTQSTALVPQRAGNYTLPELRITWFDIKDNTQRSAVLPALTIEVAAGDTATQPNNTASTNQQADINSNNSASMSSEPSPLQPPAATSTSNYWPYATAAAIIGWALTTILLLRRRTPPAHKPTTAPKPGRDKNQWNALQTACTNNNAIAARQALHNWLGNQPQHAPHSPALKQAINELDKALYSNQANTHWQGTALLDACKTWRSSKPEQSDQTLQLYPSHTQQPR